VHLRAPLLAAAAALALAPACSGAGEAAAANGKNGKTPGPRPAKVVVAEARAGAVEDVWSFPGEARARARAQLAAGAGGEVVRVTVRIGDRVKRGELLVEVDPDLAAARLAVARARVQDAEENLAQAVREAKRLAKLREGVVPELEREQTRSQEARAAAELAARKAEAREARAQLDLHRLRAPFDGVVARRSVDRGDWVRVGDPALEVVSDGELDVIVDAGPALVGKVQAGDRARLRRPVEAELRVVGVVPALDPTTRTLRVRLVPVGEVAGLLPGASVEVGFPVRLGGDGGVVVPHDAVLFDGSSSRVVVNDGGKAALLDVEVLARSESEVMVAAEGLAPGAEVLVRGNERVRPGQPLEVEEG
jgi:RND family efflux transporter MFP subunit